MVTPFKITDIIDDKIMSGSLGGGHTILITEKRNDVITFGSNSLHQCSRVMTMCQPRKNRMHWKYHL